jgi:hypothetical protein
MADAVLSIDWFHVTSQTKRILYFEGAGFAFVLRQKGGVWPDVSVEMS